MNSYSFFVEGGRGGGQLIKKIQPPDEGLIRERGGGGLLKRLWYA